MCRVYKDWNYEPIAAVEITIAATPPPIYGPNFNERIADIALHAQHCREKLASFR